MEPAPAVRKRGWGPTGVELTRRFVSGSMRSSEFPTFEVTQRDPESNNGLNEPAGMLIRAAILLVDTSTLVSSPAAKVTSQTLPAPVVMPPSESAGPAGIVA